MPPEMIFDLSQLDFNRPIADGEAIRAVNPQRAKMQQLDAVVYLNKTTQIFVGYKDIRHDEFWVNGHMPGYPLMPGVVICEVAAQLCSYYVRALKLVGGDYFGFLGMNDIRFRGSVVPGDRLVVIAHAKKVHPRQSLFDAQGFVGSKMVFNGEIMGVQLTKRS